MIEGDSSRAGELTAEIDRLTPRARGRPSRRGVRRPTTRRPTILERRLAALAGQLRAVAVPGAVGGAQRRSAQPAPAPRDRPAAAAAATGPVAAARRPQLGVAGRPPRAAAGGHRPGGRADRAAAAAVTRLLDGGGGGRGAATRVRGDVHARRRTGARHRRWASGLAGLIAVERCTRPAARRSCSSACWRGWRTRPSRPASPSGSGSSPPLVVFLLNVDHPGHAGDRRRAAARHARRRRAGAARVRAVADLVRGARARLAGRAGRAPSAGTCPTCSAPTPTGTRPPTDEIRRISRTAAAGAGQRRVDGRAVAVGAAGAPDRSRAGPGGAGDRSCG